MTNSYHTVICSVTRGLVEGPDRQCTPCVMLPTNPAPYTIVEWGIQTARYNLLVNLENIQVKSANHIISIAISNAPIVVGGIRRE